MSFKDRNALIEQSKEKVLNNEKITDKAVKEIMFVYDETAAKLETEIHALYQKFATDNKLTEAAASKLLSDKQYSVWRKSIEEYLKDIDSEGSGSKTLLELNTLAMKSRISVKEQLLSNVYRNMLDLAEDSTTKLESVLADIVKVNYTEGAFRVQSSLGIGFSVTRLSEDTIKEVLAYPWDTKRFSQSIWDKSDKIAAVAKHELSLGFASGSSVEKMAKSINDIMDKGKYAAQRLVRTECSYFSGKAELMSYQESGITRYRFLGGSEGSEHCACGALNGQTFDVDKAEVGVNYPPMHPNCKCTTVAVVENSIFDERNDTEPLLDNIKLQEWQERYVQDGIANNFDLDIAKENYKEFLQSVPKKNKMYLEFYSGITEYVDNPNFNGTFAYSLPMDKIIFNSSHSAFKNIDFNIANTHELAHRIDILYSKSWLSKKFLSAIKKSEKDTMKFKSILESQSAIDEQGFFSDIISALSHDSLTLNFGHNSEYWDIPLTKEREIFANIFCLESYNSSYLEDIKAYFPNVYKEYLKLMEG